MPLRRGPRIVDASGGTGHPIYGKGEGAMKNPFLATMPLTMTVHGKGDEIHAIIRAAWPFMVLTPREVHAFARLLSRAADALYQRKPCTPDSFTQEALATTDARLEKKLQFIPLSPCLDYPALLDLCDNEIELTADELLTLEVDVMMIAVS